MLCKLNIILYAVDISKHMLYKLVEVVLKISLPFRLRIFLSSGGYSYEQ
jgi:hypothetical protein